MNLESAAAKAESSIMWKYLLNKMLHRMVPFNKPHGFWVDFLNPSGTQIKIPFKRFNQNHIKGIHACAMATSSEYASGLFLLYKLGTKKYRIIMESLSVSYHYQGKTNAFSRYALSDEELEKQVYNPLKKEDKVYLLSEVKTFDENENLLCIAKVNWQIKKWSSVKTKN